MNISNPRHPGHPSVRRPRRAAALIAGALALAAGAATGAPASAASASTFLQKSGSTLRVESQSPAQQGGVRVWLSSRGPITFTQIITESK
jgi:hypothetical protein